MLNNVSSDKKILKILKKIWSKILLGFRKYSAISKRFWVDPKEIPENCSRDFTLTWGNFKELKKN